MSGTLSVTPITTRVFQLGEDLAAFACESVPEIRERSILVVTSKIVSLAERAVHSKAGISKQELVRREAERDLGECMPGFSLSVKHGLVIPAAGIDESNSESGDYVLFPRDPFGSARALHHQLRARYGIQELGIILSDSHVQPLRKGTVGIALAYWGFRAVKDLAGSPDLFGRKLEYSAVNIADGLAAAAVVTMGESTESRPLAVIQGAQVEFQDVIDPREIQIAPERDLFRNFFRLS